MGGYNGKYSRNPFSVFNEEKDYAFALLPEGVPVTDDDSNDDRLCLYTKLRRGNQLFGDAGTANDAFRVQQAVSTTNNFKLTGGGVGNTDINAAGRFFLKGHSCVLLSDTDYLNDVATIAKQSLHPRITNVFYNGSATVVEDSAANWATNELVARTVTIAGADYTVVTQPTVDTFTVAGDQTALIDIGDYYILKLTTPSGSAREDAVYLNLYIDEFDGTDDPDIMKSLGGTSVEAQLRAKVIHTLFVRQDNPGFGALADYVDSNGNSHLIFKLATLNRPNGDATILTAYITDHVPTIGFTNIDQSQIGVLKVVPTLAGADNTVYVQEGSFTSIDGDSIVTYPGGSYLSTFPVVTALYERWDLVTISDAGVITRIAGTEATPVGTAVKPDLPGTSTPLAYIYVDESATVVIDTEDIFDARPVISGENRGTILGTRPVSTTAPTQRQTLVWDNTSGNWFPESMAGWKVLDSSLGTVSAQLTDLGVSDGDRFWLKPGSYTLGASVDITANNVTISGPRSAVIDAAGYGITLSGAKVVLDGVKLQVTATTTAVHLVSVSGNDCKITDVEMVDNAANYRRYAIYLVNTANRCIVSRCTITGVSNTGTDPSAIMFQVGGTNVGCEILDCTITMTITTAAAFCIQGCDASTASATFCRIAGNKLTLPNTTFGVWAIRPYSRWVIENNEIVGDVSMASGGGTDSGAINVDFTVTGIKIIKNYMKYLFYGIYNLSTGACTETTVTTNTVIGVYRGIFFGYSSSNHCIVNDNTITFDMTGSTWPINISGDYCSVGHNIIYTSCTYIAYGVVISGDFCTASNNTIYATTTGYATPFGIRLSSCRYSVVSSNTIYINTDVTTGVGNYASGIDISAASRCQVSDNQVDVVSDNASQSPSAYCIWVELDTSDDMIIEDNMCRYPGGGANSPIGIYFGAACDRCVVQGNHAHLGFDASRGIDFGNSTGVCSGNVVRSAIQGVLSADVTGANVAF